MNDPNRTVKPRNIDSLITNDVYTNMVLKLNNNKK